jgi:hypothetical protein
MKARQEVTKATAGQYRGASKKEKGKILDQFVATTGYSRWYARLGCDMKDVAYKPTNKRSWWWSTSRALKESARGTGLLQGRKTELHAFAAVSQKRQLFCRAEELFGSAPRGGLRTL